MLDLSWYYCCLANPESFVLPSYAAAWAVSSGFGLSPLEYDLLWSIFPYSGPARRRAFMAIYFLHTVTVVNPVTELPEDRVVPSDEAYWADVYAALFDGRLDCVDGCEQSKVP